MKQGKRRLLTTGITAASVGAALGIALLISSTQQEGATGRPVGRKRSPSAAGP